MSDSTGQPARLSVYESLAGRIRRSIREGKYAPGQLVGSEHELSRQENISRVTVRRASELLINEGLLERRAGKGLYVRTKPSTHQVVQVIAGNLEWAPCVQMSRAAQALARERNVLIQLYDAHGDLEADLAMLRQLPEGPAQGAIIVSVHNPSFGEAVLSLKLKGFPFVLVDQHVHDIDVPSVTADNYAGGYQVGQTFLKMGHRRIAFVGPLSATTVRDRLAGLRDAIADAELPFYRNMVLDLPVENDPMGNWSQCVDQSLRELLARPVRPTALFCSCDAVAHWAYQTLAKVGLRIPQDISVAGFDDDPLVQWLTPSLTTVRQPFQEMGQVAIELLCQRMADPDAPVERRVLPVQLVMRDSVAAAKNN